MFFLSYLLFSTTDARAQTNTGRLVGTVFDVSGGLLPGAKVVVKDKQTLKERTVITDDHGGFRIPMLDIGSYQVIISCSGFRAYTADPLVIEVGREYSIQSSL